MNNQNPDNQSAQERDLPQALRPLEEVINNPVKSTKLIVPQEAFAKMHGYEDE